MTKSPNFSNCQVEPWFQNLRHPERSEVGGFFAPSDLIRAESKDLAALFSDNRSVMRSVPARQARRHGGEMTFSFATGWTTRSFDSGSAKLSVKYPLGSPSLRMTESLKRTFVSRTRRIELETGMKNFVTAMCFGLAIATVVYLVYGTLLFFDIRAHSWPQVPITEATSFPPGYAFFAALLSVPLSFPIGTILAWLLLVFLKRAQPAAV